MPDNQLLILLDQIKNYLDNRLHHTEGSTLLTTMAVHSARAYMIIVTNRSKTSISMSLLVWSVESTFLYGFLMVTDHSQY